MLNSIADSMEFESNMAIDKMVATLEPVINRGNGYYCRIYHGIRTDADLRFL